LARLLVNLKIGNRQSTIDNRQSTIDIDIDNQKSKIESLVYATR